MFVGSAFHPSAADRTEATKATAACVATVEAEDHVVAADFPEEEAVFSTTKDCSCAKQQGRNAEEARPSERYRH